MTLYEVVIQGGVENMSTREYTVTAHYESYIESDLDEEELASEIISQFEEQGYRLFPTKEMMDSGIYKVEVNIRSEF